MQILKAMTEQEEKKLLKAISEIKGVKAERDYIICLLGFYAGLRLSELIGLNIGDVRNKERLHIRKEIAKRAKERVVPLNVKLQRALRNWLKIKIDAGESISDEAPLFISRKGNRLSKRSLQEMFEYWCIRSGLEHNGRALYTVHSMRHSFAKRMIQRGARLEVVQKLLGHKSLASTGIYIAPGYEEMENGVNLL